MANFPRRLGDEFRRYRRTLFRVFFILKVNEARIPFVDETQCDDDEDEVEEEHHDSHALGHAPSKYHDGKEHANEHQEEKRD